jgi:ppGpp synthetase/RelA/SpoT-type nucleotidyltranferase
MEEKINLSVKEPLNLDTYDSFIAHQSIRDLKSKFAKLKTLAGSANKQLIEKLEELNKQHNQINGEVLFSAIDGRVKKEESFFRKLFSRCQEDAKKEGLSQALVTNAFDHINDIAGVRFSCPYMSGVKPAIFDIIREKLSPFGYATSLNDDDRYKDKDYLKDGDLYGYRSFHFFIKVPAVIDIYGNTEAVLCEVQARSELQHIWAVKSHDLLYKNDRYVRDLEDYREDMRHLSEHLKVADHFLDRIRAQLIENSRNESDTEDKI